MTQQQYWLWIDKQGNPIQTAAFLQAGGPLFPTKADAQHAPRAPSKHTITRALIVPPDQVGVTRDPDAPEHTGHTAEDLRRYDA